MDLDVFLERISTSPQQGCFFHFTDRRNLRSIRKHGLLPTRELRRREIEIPAPGGNQWSQEADAAAGMDAYVHLCFKTGHPMEKRAQEGGNIQDLVHLQVRPDIIRLPKVLITDDVANKRGVKALPATSMLDELDLEVLYTRTNWSDPAIRGRLVAAEKCEILIPGGVPVDYILNLDDG